jgi:hypothetical protein
MIMKRARRALGHRWQPLRLALLLTVVLVGGQLVSAGSAAAATPISSFDAGVFTAGQTKHKVWNNANSDAYAVGLTSVGVDDSDAFCRATVLRSWYVRQATGEREFHLIIEGDPSERCRIRVWLGRLTASRSTPVGVIKPGGGITRIWNNAQTDRNIYVIGILGATPLAGACEFEVKTRYQTRPDGENEFAYTATNVGSVACGADLRMVTLPVTERFDLGTFRAGGKTSLLIGFETTTNVVVGGLNPRPVADGICQWAPGLVQTFDVGRLDFDYTNTAVTQWCGADATFTVL